MTPTKTKTNPLAAWNDRFFETLAALKQARQRLDDLRSIPQGGDEGEKFALLRGLWQQLGIANSSPEGIRAYAEVLRIQLSGDAMMVAQSFRLLLDDVAVEIARLAATGAEDPNRPPLLLAAAFGRFLWTTTEGVLLADPTALPEGHPAKTLCEPGELHRSNNRLLLVLGHEGRPFFELADVRRLTLEWSSPARLAADERAAREKIEQAREADRFAESLEGRLAAAEAELADWREKAASGSPVGAKD